MIQGLNSGSEALKREARSWVRQLASGEATTTDADLLKRWRRQSAAHEAAFAEAVRVWKDLGPGGQAFVARRGAPVWSGQRGTATRRAVLAGGGLLAASGAALAVVRPPLDLWPSLEQWRADYRTATGEQRRLTVAGVTVEMNTQTSIALAPEASGADSVRLISGEASFAIPAGSSRPLVVLAVDGRAVATQGRFDVRTTAADTRVTCLDGEVKVEKGDRSALVGAGQQAGFNEAGLSPAVAVDASDITSWHDGFIVFRATPLAAAAAEINRYRPGRVVVLSVALGRKTVSGRFRIERTDEILGWMVRATGATSRSLPGGIVLLS
ncbi:MAG: FecR domain-containing protein [Rhodoplanes sp.]|uniref:FecR family protein n=1 Tax=Rhodoplanes sp. TaxID=1968906 RepID=UPI0017B10113|nr:FecR domain-containing protein [Rhodoplanes sp.]NVO17721.1 FecR domain-containing protein [Rhodoplanes sp.]